MATNISNGIMYSKGDMAAGGSGGYYYRGQGALAQGRYVRHSASFSARYRQTDGKGFKWWGQT